jgi:flagellar basal-body rod protein FlgG
MDQILATAGAGMQTQNFLIGAVADNLANVDTQGYGQRVAAATGGGGISVRPPGVVLMGMELLVGASLPSAAVPSVSVPAFSDGVVESSSPTSLAISGPGFFQVQLPTGQIGYTRAGAFSVDANGQLVNPAGDRLVPPIIVPPGASNLTVAQNGGVSAQLHGRAVSLGTITVAVFPNDAGLSEAANGVYLATANSGPPTIVNPGQGGAGQLVSGALNASGVNVAHEMVKLIQASTAYSLSAKLMTVGQSLDQLTTQMTS